MNLLDEIRKNVMFAPLPDDQLMSLVEMGKEVNLDEGTELLHEGDKSHGMYLLLDGELEVIKNVNGQAVVITRIQPVAYVGEISLLTGVPHTATVLVTKPSRFLHYGVDLFKDSLDASPVLGIILSTMFERLRNTEAMVQQHEKLSALGRMSAGLAHELNNPASASTRAAKQLQNTLNSLQSAALKLFRLDEGQLTFLIDLQDQLVERTKEPLSLDPLAQSDLEQQMEVWLEEQGIENAWQLAPSLVTSGLKVEQLDEVTAHIDRDALGDVLVWLEATVTASGLVTVIERSSSRISDLVQAVKSYSYMDQAPLQNLDIHEGLENTLTIMGYKLKNINVVRDYDRSLPKITAYGSELNQVWTNLIDNAIDALDGKGTITIRTWRDDNDRIQVEISDNGPGIPENIQRRMFEPFFTTKPVGKGTGLGLDIAYKIIVTHHKGNIHVASEPGNTRFQICLPNAMDNPES